MPADAVYVGRPTLWGNPMSRYVWGAFTVGEAVADYRRWVTGEPTKWKLWGGPPPTLEQIRTLRGKDLACWCSPGAPCHADVLLELANA